MRVVLVFDGRCFPGFWRRSLLPILFLVIPIACAAGLYETYAYEITKSDEWMSDNLQRFLPDRLIPHLAIIIVAGIVMLA